MASHVLHDRDGALADERSGHRVGAHAVARDTASGVGGAHAKPRDVEAPQTGGGPTFGQGVTLAPPPLESLLVPSPGGEARRAYPDLLGRLTASAPCSSARRIRSSRLASERSACRSRSAEPRS